MANEFKHLSVGGEISQAEYEAVGGHVLASQAIGDIIYATSTSQLSRLGIGSTGAVLTVTGGIPAWDTTWTPTGDLIPATDDTYDLGSASAAWQDLFLEGDITLTDAGTLATSAGALTVTSAAAATWSTSAGALTVTSAGALNLNPAGGSAIVLDTSTTLDGGVLTFTPSTSDTVVMTAATNGAFSLVTTDNAAAAANIQITADGTVDIDSAGVLTLDSGAAINIEPASGSAILLDGTISIDAGVVTGATSITSTVFVGNVTGNASGTAATVTTAAQGNITSLGTLTGLTVSGLITANGGITFADGDDIAFTGATGTNDIVLVNGLADALSITDGSADVIAISTAGGTNTVAITGDLTVSGTIAADTAAVATTVTITDNEDTNENNAIVFTAGGDLDGGNLGLESDGTLNYNPSTGTLTTTTFVGALTGNVTGNASGTAATVTGSSQGSITTLAAVTSLGAAGATTNVVAGDVTMYNAVNDGNPTISVGSSSAERLLITASYVSGGQLLDYVKFATVEASSTANRGKYIFDVDGTDIVTIDDGGIDIASGKTFAINGSDIVGSDTTYTAGDGLGLSGTEFSTDLVSNGGLEIQSAELSVAQGISQYDVAQFAASVADNDFLRIDGTAVEGLSASEVAAAIESSIDAVGTIGTGVWQGTAIASAYIAGDAITGAKIADDAVDSEHIAAGAVDNAHLADDAVDSDELAAGAVDTAHIADNQITLAKMAGGTDGNIISYDASGDPVAIATGNDGQVLTSTGAGSPPAFEDAGGGGIALAAQWRVDQSTTSVTSIDPIVNFEVVDTDGYGGIGTAVTYSSGVFTFGATGIWLIEFGMETTQTGSDDLSFTAEIETCTDGSTFDAASRASGQLDNGNVSDCLYQSFMFDVTNTSTHKVQFALRNFGSSCTMEGDSHVNQTYATFTKLGDT